MLLAGFLRAPDGWPGWQPCLFTPPRPYPAGLRGSTRQPLSSGSFPAYQIPGREILIGQFRSESAPFLNTVRKTWAA